MPMAHGRTVTAEVAEWNLFTEIARISSIMFSVGYSSGIANGFL
jgi:hypothetical protein